MTTVLLIDDDRALRKLLRAYLEAEAISVLEAASGEDGLAALELSADVPISASADRPISPLMA